MQAPLRAVRTVPGPKDGRRLRRRRLLFGRAAERDRHAVKPADDGEGVIVRVRETSGSDVQATVTSALPGVARAWRCDLSSATCRNCR